MLTDQMTLSAADATLHQATDMEALRVASQAFYSALAVLDDGEAMAQVWAHTEYVTYAGPHTNTIIVGWDAQRRYWVEFNKIFVRRTVSLAKRHFHANGNLAWEIGIEVGEAQLADGIKHDLGWVATNVFERLADRWLMVSHHVQPKER
jgi:ketosteroid isomerase-like protein